MKYFLLLAVLLLFSCNESHESQQQVVPYTNVRFRNYLFVDVVVNDTLSCTFLYDTGMLMGSSIDTTVVPAMEFFHIGINGTVLNAKNRYPLPYEVIGAKGMLAAEYHFNPDTLVWDMNFDRMGLSISADDSIPTDAVVIPIEKRGALPALYARVPLKIYCGERSIDTDYLWMIDTGNPFAFAMTNPTMKMLNFSSSAPEKAEFIESWTINNPQALHRNFSIDSILIAGKYKKTEKSVGKITTGEPGRSLAKQGAVGTLGMEILKESNFKIDLKNNLLVLYESRYKPKSDLSIRYARSNPEGILYNRKDSSVVRIEKGRTAHLAGVKIGDSKNEAAKKMDTFLADRKL